MSEMVLNGSMREVGRKGPARKLRREGKLPGIVYGLGDNVSVTVEAKDVLKILKMKGGVNNILLTKFDGDKKERRVMIKELDSHPMNDTLLHIDFIEIDVTKPISVSVELEFSGVSVGVKDKGGKMNISMSKLRVECMPVDIPTSIPMDLTNLDVGDTWRVEDINIGSNVKVLDDLQSQVVSVTMPKIAVEEAAGDEEGEATGGDSAAGDGAAKETKS